MSHWLSGALLLVITSVAVPALAQTLELTGVLKRVQETGVLGVGYSESSVPFSYLDSSRKPIGYAIDICNNVIEAIKTEIRKPDLKVEMRSIKPDDATSYVVSGVVD